MIPSSHLSKIYRAGWGTLTDLYQLTMAYGYWQQGLHDRPAVFHLFFRRHPFKGNYTVAAGLAMVADYLQNFSFTVEEIQYLGSLRGSDGKAMFSETFLHYLQRLRFTGSLHAVPEGTLVHPHTPLLRIEAPLLQAQLIETALLTLVNFSSLIATKAARIKQAAGDDIVLEFGLRRAQGIDGGLTASRSAYIGGCDASSNVWAGVHLGIPVKGTHAHSWVMVFADELEAFAAYAEAMPNNCTFLVDTYDTLDGVKNAIRIGSGLREQGHQMMGIRLDSGDLAELSIGARTLLDEAGFTEVAIVASNDLDEYRIKTLKEKGATITAWGIGTRLATAYDQPALGGVYKLAALANAQGEWEPRIKLSEQAIKTSNPWPQTAYRCFREGVPVADVIARTSQSSAKVTTFVDYATGAEVDIATTQKEPLLVEVFESGTLTYSFPSLSAIREHCQQQLSQYAEGYAYGLETTLHAEKQRMIKQKS